MTAARITMADHEFAALRAIIRDRSGTNLPDDKRYILECRLNTRLAELGFDCFDHYLRFLTIGPYQRDEFLRLLRIATINETAFFRDPEQFDLFERSVLPAIIAARSGTKTLRVWSVGCSTGEETYSIAICIHRVLGIALADWSVEILGSDISEAALEHADNARYDACSLRELPDLVKARYFDRDEQGWTPCAALQRMVSFQRHDLNDRLGAERLGVWDIVFCRATLGSFAGQHKQLAIDTLADHLAADGALVLSPKDSIRGVAHDLRSDNGTGIYLMPEARSATAA